MGPNHTHYNVFLSHNSKDKPLVRAVAEWLGRHGVRYFLDENNLEPGDPLPDKLGAAMDQSGAAAVFIGSHGEGPWMHEEVNSLLNRAIKLSRQKDEFRIIPVMLPNADTANLRWFLQTRLWVDLSNGVTDSEAELFRLKQAILGKADASVISTDSDFNPYMGLAAFQAKDADFFFGRAKACRELADKLKEWRFVCVIGPSGNGKSSLAQAGLATEAAESICTGISSWRRKRVTPAGNLLRSFLEQLNADRPEGERAEAVETALKRVESPDRKAEGEDWAAALDAEFGAWFAGSDQPVLFLIDQFEEVFTQRALRIASEEDRAARASQILKCMAILAERGNPRWLFVLTLREDFLERCRVSPEFWDLISTEQRVLRLDELDEEGWREAIKGPAARAGAYLEAGLVETMLKDVSRQPGSMPLLQLALRELWRKRQDACLTHSAYTTLGGVAKALQNRATSALRKLELEKPEYLEIARNLFLRLTSLAEGVSDTRRRADRSELDWEKTDPKDLETVLARLSDADHRLIVVNENSVEVTHEVLIRESQDIRQWLDGPQGAREDIPILRRLSYAARQWAEGGRRPVFLNAAGPSRELQLWTTRATLRLTHLERAYIQESRADRSRQFRERRTNQQALKRAEEEKMRQAQLAELQRARQRRLFLVTTFALLGVAVFLLAIVLGRNKSKAIVPEPWVDASSSVERGGAIAVTHQLLRNALALETVGENDQARVACLASVSTVPPVRASLLHDGPVYGAALSPNGRQILTWSGDGTARLWDASSGAAQGQIMRHGMNAVNGARYSPDGQRILTWSGDGVARLWTAADGSPLGHIMQHESRITGASFDANGTWILTCSEDGTARIWEGSTGAPSGRVMNHGSWVLDGQFSGDQQRILTYAEDGMARLWDANTGALVAQVIVPGARVQGAMFSRKGERILTWSTDASIRLWDATNGRAIGQPMKHEQAIEGIRFSADGRRILTWSQDATARLWDANRGAPIGHTMIHGDPVKGALFTSGGNQVLTWSTNGVARLWSATDGTTQGTAIGLGARLTGLEFSPDGRRILTWDLDVGAQLWCAANGERLGLAMGHEKWVNGARFSADGARVLTWSEDGTARLWDVSDCQCGKLPRDIKLDETVSSAERLLEFEVRSATTVGVNGQMHLLSTKDWNVRKRRLLEVEIQAEVTITESGVSHRLSPQELAALKDQLAVLQTQDDK